MEKEIVSLMCKRIAAEGVDVDLIALTDPEWVIEYIHIKYRQAERQYNKAQCIMPIREISLSLQPI
jgi:hypothetical protein